MSRRRKHCDSPGRAGSEEKETRRQYRNSQNKTITNKLSRAFRQTQRSPSLDSSCLYEKDLKTPKRHTRIGFNHLNNADSPNNDAELQQDIIWDATSPTPAWNEKGVKKFPRNEGPVDISEIVNRIVPKDERPNVPESSLLQWIGDGAIPYTPEVRHGRTRRKSNRQNAVEDLMKLAKQFDINMIQQDKVQEHQRSAEMHSCEGSPPILLGGLDRDRGTEERTDTRPAERRGDDTLDALFDGPTQSGRLSGTTPVQSQEGREDPIQMRSAAKGVKQHSLVGSDPPALPGGPSKPSTTISDFEDDWDDDLLDDSFVLEMTLNPDLSTAPSHCSTQISEPVKGPVSLAVDGAVTLLPHHHTSHVDVIAAATHWGKNEKCKSRSTFALQANPQFRANGAFCGKPQTRGQRSDSGTAENKSHGLSEAAGGPVSVVSGQKRNKITQYIPNSSHEDSAQRLFSTTAAAAPSSSCSTPPVQAGNLTHKGQRSEILGSKDRPGEHAGTGPGCTKEVSDEDLNSLFASDSLWGDDDDDDDLLCQLCDDVEKLSGRQAPSPCTGPAQKVGQSRPQAVPRPAARGLVQAAQGVESKPHCTFPRSLSEPVSHVRTTVSHAPSARPSQPPANTVAPVTQNHSKVASGASGNGKGRYKFTQVRSTAVTGGPALGPTADLQGGDKNVHSLPLSGTMTEKARQSSFKRHLSDPVTLTNKASVANRIAVKCTEAEIERKKQEALARRRLRMKETQEPRAPP